MDPAAALELRGVSKRFPLRGGGEFAAVDDVSLEVRAGEIVALLGPNGAGKTTSMQLALGLLEPDAGEARLAEALALPVEEVDAVLAALCRRLGVRDNGPARVPDLGTRARALGIVPV